MNNTIQLNEEIINNNTNTETNTETNTDLIPQSYEIDKNGEYKLELRKSKEVQDLTSEIDIDNVDSIIMFGKKPGEEISRTADKILDISRNSTNNNPAEMMENLTKVIKKVDLTELDEDKLDMEPKKGLAKIFGKGKTSLENLMNKYNPIVDDLEKILSLLMKNNEEMKKSSITLKVMYENNLETFKQLEKYIVAGEIGCEEIREYIAKVENSNMTDTARQLKLQDLNQALELLEQRTMDLRTMENVALQSAPMIRMLQTSNYNLMRKIQSSIIITVPIFKQCVVQNIELRKQFIQAKQLQQLDDVTNDLMLRSATNLKTHALNTTRMSKTTSVKTDTLRQTYDIIKQGIDEVKALNDELIIKRKEEIQELERIKADTQKLEA